MDTSAQPDDDRASPPSQLSTTAGSRAADLVLEGGGVRGLALVGAVQVLAENGYRFPRVAGTSAGAIVGAVLAALEVSGEPIGRLVDVAEEFDVAKVRDRGFLRRLLGPLDFLVDGFSILTADGAYSGNYLERRLAGVLGDLGVRTFGDLRTADPGSDGSMHHRYSLVVTASDLTRRRLVLLPWDYADYGRDPDEQQVAAAVRASASIPFVFRPVTLRGRQGSSTLVDGGLLSNYPISTFDRLDDLPPRWPTLGVRLDATSYHETRPGEPVEGPVELGLALLQTSLEAPQAAHLLDPCNVARSVVVDTGDVSAADFDLTSEDRRALLDEGRAAATRFLQTWDYPAWLSTCR